MRFRFKSTLFMILILIIVVAIIGFGYFFWTEVVSQPNIVVDGEITINYLDGSKFKSKDNKKMTFTITNNSNDANYYYIQLTDVYATNATYKIKSNTDLELNGDLRSGILFNQISIAGGVTQKWEIEFINNSDKKYSGTFKIGIKRNENNTFSEVILDNNKVKESPISNIGEGAKLDEGLIETRDGLGATYYFRGKVENNNVEFANLNWKIVKINGDGSVKLVLNTLTSEISSYYDDEYEFSKSTINEFLNKWYDNYLKYYSDYIVYNKFCNDVVVESNDTFAAYNRIVTNKIPNHQCLGTQVNLKIGLLTADEVMLAGGFTKENKDYYLYIDGNSNPYWTMTSSQIKNKVYYPFVVAANGSIQHNVAGNLLRGVRPVINIIRNAKVTGNGTVDNPYKIVE